VSKFFLAAPQLGPKCTIYLCFMCRFTVTRIINEFPVKYPMYCEEFET
jgi:hypothetical protein